MSIGEFGEMEREQMLERERKQKEAEANKPDSDSDKEEVAERKRVEASNWDNWKDEHEKGAGNKMK